MWKFFKSDGAEKRTNLGQSGRIITGRVTATGVKIAGNGWSVVKGATGMYTITFDIPFIDIPVVFIHATDTGFIWGETLLNPSVTVNGFNVDRRDTSNVVHDGAFNFLVMEVI